LHPGCSRSGHLLPGRPGHEDRAGPGHEQGYSGNVAFLTDGSKEATQFHLAEQDLKIGFKTGQAVNPLEKGHLAFRTDDIAAFKKRLDDKGIPYSDFGAWAMKGWEQVFFYDPAGNIIEVHQVHE
jgi:glyoxylase I family protein